MIITKQKSLEDIKKAIGDVRSVFLVGCGDCATLCHTGGDEDLREMTKILNAEGIEVTGQATVPATCHELDTKRILRKEKEAVEKAEGILVMACGAGIQAVGDNSEKLTVSGCDSLFIGNSRRQMHFYEKCSACGNCVLNMTGGICPETRCPKALLNGPCGGAVNGKCEVDHEQNCVWIEIYERLVKVGRLDLMGEIIRPKDFRASGKPRRLVEPRNASGKR
ncbi:MAG: methylenetetrahydrofolate reductase C-terminal domain-containing protein [Nitrospinota bacterium]|nr:methylenetetrahydrofolate reductase C-terminal domain-containing protein [Nitrospinota bacterium]